VFDLLASTPALATAGAVRLDLHSKLPNSTDGRLANDRQTPDRGDAGWAPNGSEGQ
jgi:hypothetical protein